LIAKAIFLFFLVFAKSAFLEKWILREGLQGEILLFKWNVLRENGLSHPAKGGSTPAFACQRTARPRLGSIFEKLLHRKTFSLPAARSLKPI